MEQRSLQDEFGTRPLADAFSSVIVSDILSPEHESFVGSRDFFFLASVTAEGEPTVSYKGGDVGFVKVESPSTLLFPSYDGNGMFLSLGNIEATAKVGMLFIDFETPNRVRVQGSAAVLRDSTHLQRFPGAELVVRVEIEAVFVNCGRYIHKHSRIESSPSVPDSAGHQPLAAWKRVDLLQDFLPTADQGRAEAEGGTISAEEYAEYLRNGQV